MFEHLLLFRVDRREVGVPLLGHTVSEHREKCLVRIETVKHLVALAPLFQKLSKLGHFTLLQGWISHVDLNVLEIVQFRLIFLADNGRE